VKDTTADRILVLGIYAFMIVLAVVMLYPFWEQVVLSFSTRAQALRDTLHLVPYPVSLEAYDRVLGSHEVWHAFLVTVFRVVVGTIFGLAVTAMTAYPLARDDFPFRDIFLALILFTMLFNGGLIPDYLLRKSLHLLNTLLVLILPGISAYNVIIIRSFYRYAIPRELQEAAQLDGASDWDVWWHVVLPLSKPVLATVGLWLAVSHWNAYFDALIYITDHDKYVLQVILRRILLENQIEMFLPPGTARDIGAVGQPPTPETVKAALIVVSTIPIVLIYPLLQRYFIKGITLGSLKG